jgi:HSP20 family protein
MNSLVLHRNELSPWDGFREMEDYLNQVFRGCNVERSACQTAALPAVDLREGKDAYTLQADLPGLAKEDIELTIKDDVVTLKGQRKAENKEEGQGYRIYERGHGSFQRSFRIPDGVDTAKVTAKFEHGVLEARLPKPESAQPKRIDVQVN